MGALVSNYFHGFEIRVKFYVFPKKKYKYLGVTEYIYGYFLELLVCKFARA